MTDILKMVAQSPGSMNASNSNMIIPGGLFLAAIGILTYHHTQQEAYEHTLSAFLATIVMQMIPLIALKMKIYACGDRLALVPRVIVKTLLMHLILSALRTAPQLQPKYFDPWTAQLWFDVGALLSCFFMLRQTFGFRFSFRSFIDEMEVRNLTIMALLGAAATESACLFMPEAWMSEGTKLYVRDGDLLGKILFTAANYVDVLAFMPVVWKLHQAENDDDESSGTQVHEEARRQVLLFFAFVVAFYSWDDVIDPLRFYDRQESVAMMAHAAHFVLLMDFACFFVFQVWSPSAQKGEQLQGLLSEGYEDDA